MTGLLQGPPPAMPALSWAYRLAESRAGLDADRIRLGRLVVDLLCAQPGLLRQLADEAEKTLRS